MINQKNNNYRKNQTEQVWEETKIGKIQKVIEDKSTELFSKLHVFCFMCDMQIY